MRATRPVLLTLLVGLLLAVRLATPLGFMPGVAKGQLALVECPDFSPPVSSKHGSHDKHDTKIKSPCPFAAVASNADVPTPIALTSATTAPTETAMAALISVPLPILRGARPPATGPPTA